mmetsp:Transcript_9041/g.23750  ORF Transcript_9041/g.23750 Transcript_9041/m.23750 type:complete len:298 (+) Transcript_9041:822-1715(+)
MWPSPRPRLDVCTWKTLQLYLGPVDTVFIPCVSPVRADVFCVTTPRATTSAAATTRFCDLVPQSRRRWSQISKIAVRAADVQRRHEQNHRPQKAERDGGHQQRTKLGEKQKDRSKQECTSAGSGDRAVQHTDAHVGKRIARTVEAVLVRTLNVRIPKMNHIVDRESDNDHSGHGFNDAKLPTVQVYAPQHRHHDAADTNCGQNRCYHIQRRENERHEGDHDGKAHAKKAVVYKRVLRNQKRPHITATGECIVHASRILRVQTGDFRIPFFNDGVHPLVRKRVAMRGQKPEEKEAQLL